eukprot:4744247-Amphidinium_carterae.1
MSPSLRLVWKSSQIGGIPSVPDKQCKATAIRNQRALYQQQALQAAAQNRQQALAWFSERKQLQEELKRAVTELQAGIAPVFPQHFIIGAP